MSDERWIPGGEEEPVSPAEQMPQPVRPAAMRSFDEDPDAPSDPDAPVIPEFSQEYADWQPPAPVVPVFDEADAGATDPDSTPKVVSFDPDAPVEAEDAQPYSDMPEPEGGSVDEAFRPGADEAEADGADVRPAEVKREECAGLLTRRQTRERAEHPQARTLFVRKPCVHLSAKIIGNVVQRIVVQGKSCLDFLKFLMIQTHDFPPFQQK